jgi:hypothetical protein
VDHNFTDRDRTFFRYSIRRDDKLQNGPLPLEAFAGGSARQILPADNVPGAGLVLTPLYTEARFGFALPTV